MKRRYSTKSGKTPKADAPSKKIRIASRSKESERVHANDELYERYAAVMSYYYHSEAAEIRNLITAANAMKPTF
ncbi:hypothetical protein [Chitinophaga sp.]|uniref:hypothetical protein n=1 Tax=Chitinophaga sp. TaxID=1869181 RepID=UPI002D073598|nr:hypothetical protein [Chitinophaga sp.]HWV65516.1 hypothetical protein [Chitinophaga sp.]